jgi:predicted membrane protein
LEFNALKLGVSSSLLLLLLIATMIVIKAFSYPKKEKIPLFFIIGPGAIWRLSFSIPFIILNLGLTYYLYKSFSTELT